MRKIGRFAVLCGAMLVMAGVACQSKRTGAVSDKQRQPTAAAVAMDELLAMGVDAKVADLAGMSGCWFGRLGEADWECCYTTVAYGELVSANKEIRQNRVAMFEWERFFERDGKVLMTPYPFGQGVVTFVLTGLVKEPFEATFTHPTHDFPSRIIYHVASKDRLVITLHGAMEGNAVIEVADLARGVPDMDMADEGNL